MMLVFAFAVMSGSVFAQTKTVSGKVTSSQDGLGIPGATIQIKGTTVGAITDIDGRYSINVSPSHRTLVFSYVSMKTVEIAIGTQTTINVTMEPDVVQIDEIVVTALGISREKKSLGYTVQEASGQEMVRAANPSFESTLSGKFAGVQVRQSSGMPGAPSQIYIRGARAFSGNNAPLYVVDGMPIASESDYTSNVTGSAYSNRAADIDPNDIESINVLKGQAAAALYGQRASNGVIIITTKKGKGLAATGKPVVSFSSSYVLDNVSRLPEVQMVYAQGSGGNYAPANSFTWGQKLLTCQRMQPMAAITSMAMQANFSIHIKVNGLHLQLSTTLKVFMTKTDSPLIIASISATPPLWATTPLALEAPIRLG